MSRLRRLVAERHWIFATTAASVFAYAALASLTRPFTVEADVATALPLFAAAILCRSDHGGTSSDHQATRIGHASEVRLPTRAHVKPVVADVGDDGHRHRVLGALHLHELATIRASHVEYID